MGFSYRIYVELRFALEIFVEMLTNSLRFTPFGPKRLKDLPNIDGKVALITGSNTGIGKETARVLSKLGAKIIMACRDTNKGDKAAEDIRKDNPNANIVVMKLDLSSLASVRQFVDKVFQQESQIDLLINNAGVMMCPKWKTEDGFEMQIGTNHLGHFLLTLLMLDLLKKSPNARIINVSSIAHIRGEIQFDDIHMDKNYTSTGAYAQSKLANVLFSRELAKRLSNSNTNIKVYCLHPGLINTDLQRHLTGLLAFAYNLLHSIVQIDAQLGAQTTLYCALLSNEESGHYYKDCKRVNNMVNAVDDISARKLWKLSCDLVGIEDKI